MRTVFAFVAFSILVAATSVAAADSLTVTSESEGLTVERFEYRRISTRAWYTWVGCWTYDFLQGSGWFPTTWYSESDFDADGSVELSRTWGEKYCAAAMDEINSVFFTYSDASDSGRVFLGRFRIVPGVPTTDTVLCELVDESSDYRNFECTEASVNVDEEDVSVQIDLAL